jgi:hypothetical protein
MNILPTKGANNAKLKQIFSYGSIEFIELSKNIYFLEYFKKTSGKKMQGFSMVLQFFKVFRGVKDIFVQLKI